MFPISRDPPEGGTSKAPSEHTPRIVFPISRDPPEGGTVKMNVFKFGAADGSFQFLGIPPKGEPLVYLL